MTVRRADVVVIGGGPAGIAAAVEASRSGRSVTLVSDTPIGGRAMHASLLPSKLLLHLAEERATRGQKELAPPSVVAELGAAIERTVAQQLARASERLSDGGVSVVSAAARFAGPRSLLLDRGDRGMEELAFQRAIVATGSVPFFPPGFLGEASAPDGERIFAPRFVRKLRSLPETMLVVGAGVTGAEAVSAFTDLGVRVTWLIDDHGILPRFDRELANSLGDVLMERGVKIVHGKRVQEVVPSPQANAPADQRVLAKLDGGRTYAAERAFLAIGRRTDDARLSPEAAGLTVEPRTGALVVDAAQRTNVPEIFAAGDAVGAPFTANKAMAEAFVAARHATDRAAAPLRREALIEAVYARPELARVGTTPEESVRGGASVEVRVASYEASLRGVIEGAGRDPHARGTLKVVLDGDERIVGATAVGPRASDVLAPIATAIQLGANAESLRALFLAEPSLTAIALDALR